MIPLKPKIIASPPKKESNGDARFSSIQGPAPASRAKAIRRTASIPTGSQACRSDEDGIIMLLMANVR